MPISPNTPEGPPPPLTFNQSPEEVKGCGPLLSEVSKGSGVRKVTLEDRSAAPPDSKTPTSNPEHPYIRLYQYLHRKQGAPPHHARTAAALSLDKPKGGGAMTVGANGSGAVSPAGSSKLRPAGNGSSGFPPPTRAAAPRPHSHRHENTSSPSPRAESPIAASHLPSTSPSALHPDPPVCRCGNLPLPPATPDSTLPLPTKPPPSPSKNRVLLPSGGSPASSTLVPPVPLGGEPQRHNSLSSKRPVPSPGGPALIRVPAPTLGAHTPIRGPATLPPPSSPTPLHGPRLPPPAAAPPTPLSSSSLFQAGIRDAPPPPYRTPGCLAHCFDPPTRNPTAPPPLCKRHSPTVHRSFVDDFESKYSFHPLDDFSPPDEYKHFTKIYPSKASRVMKGAPPLPPVGK